MVNNSGGYMYELAWNMLVIISLFRSGAMEVELTFQ
jgi:hypothetical protein